MSRRVHSFPCSSLAYLTALICTCSLSLSAQCEFASFQSPSTFGFEHFGSSLDVEGNRAAIASPDEVTTTTGSVTLLTRNGLNWYLEDVLRTPDAIFDNSFASHLALGNDLLVVGAPNDDDAGSNSGAAYVFELQLGQWVWTQKLLPDPQTTSFGTSVAVDGETIFVIGSGSLATFERGPTEWELVGDVDPVKGGFSGAIAVDGDRLVLGSKFDDTTGAFAGAAYVYEQLSGVWVEQARLDPPAPAFLQVFGDSVAISQDRILIGSPLLRGNGGTSTTGGGFLFEGSGPNWTLIASLSVSGTPVFEMGRSAVLSADGTQAVLGCPGNTIGKETAQVFSEASNWSAPVELQASAGPMVGDFGGSMALCGDTLLVGASLDSTVGPGSGGAYVFSLSGDLCPTHSALPSSISLAAGGTQSLRIQAGSEHGGELFILAGSSAGTDPGLVFGSSRIPLNFDDYLLLTLAGGSGSPLVTNTGTLPASGTTTVSLVVPPQSDPSLAGLVLNHAFVLLGGGSGLSHVSNTTSLTLDL